MDLTPKFIDVAGTRTRYHDVGQGEGGDTQNLYRELSGSQYLNDVVLVDQSPIGRTPRSNPVTYIKAFDTALQDVDVLIMPTCVVTAPKNYKPATYLEALEDNLSWMSRGASQNTQPTNYTGHPALQ